MNATQTETKPAQGQAQNHAQPIQVAKMADDIVSLLASGATITYIPLGEEEAIKLSVGMIQRLCAHRTKSGAMPTYDDCVKYGMLCRSRRLNPFVGDCYLVGYDSQQDGPQFSMIVAVQALLKRAEVHPQFDGLESGVVVLTKEKQIVEYQGDLVLPGDTLIGGWAKVYRKDRKRPIYQRLQLSTFNKGTKFWKNDPAGQISKTAEAHSLRQGFPSDVGGLFLEAEIEAFSDAAAHSAANRKFEFEPPAAKPIVDLDTLTTPAPEAQERPARRSSEPQGVQQPTNGNSGQQTSQDSATQTPEGQETSGSQSEAGESSQTAGDSAQVQNGETGGEQSDAAAAAEADAKIETWQADIEAAGTNGRLDTIADLAKVHAPQAIRGQVMQLIGEKRAKLKSKK